MSGKLAETLVRWLDAGRNLMGEIRIERSAEGFSLRHWLDENVPELKSYTRPEDAIELGKYDVAGKYRPLRTAPSLGRGWQLFLPTAQETVRALDFFYPAMLGTALAFEKGTVHPVNLRHTVNRQTGMYRITGKITNEQADGLIGEACAAKNCLKTITWKIEPDFPIGSLPVSKMDLAQDTLGRVGDSGGLIPLPCEECCNMLVAAARETVKKTLSTTPPPA